MSWQLHDEVRPILDGYRGKLVVEAYKDAADNAAYFGTERAESVLTEEDLKRKKTIWHAVWGLLHGVMREGRGREQW